MNEPIYNPVTVPANGVHMLILVSVLLGIVTVATAVHGGILASAENKHKRWFVFYGVFAVVLLIAQGILVSRQETANHKEMRELKGAVINLRDQAISLGNAVKLQVSIDDLRHLETVIANGFAACFGGKKPAQPITPPQPALPPAVVEHIRIVQRRAASDDPKAPFGLQVVMQSDVTIQPVAFRVEFDKPIVSAKTFIVGEGAYMSVATAYSQDKRAFMFSWKYPPLTPDASLVVSVTSEFDVRVTKVEKIQPLF